MNIITKSLIAAFFLCNMATANDQPYLLKSLSAGEVSLSAAPMVIQEQLRIISDVVTPDAPEDLATITTELAFWKSQGYNAVLFAYYGEPTAQVEPLLEAIDSMGLYIIFAFADYAVINTEPVIYSPRWMKPERYVKASQRATDQHAINKLLPYCDAVLFHWRGSQLFERQSYEPAKVKNQQLRTTTMVQQKAQSQGRIQQIRARYPNIEIWGSLDVHEMRGYSSFASWVDPDECSRIFVFGLTHSGLRAMMSRGSTINKLVASHFGEEYPVVVGPCSVAGNFRFWGSTLSPCHDTLPTRYKNDRFIARQKEIPGAGSPYELSKVQSVKVNGVEVTDSKLKAEAIATARSKDNPERFAFATDLCNEYGVSMARYSGPPIKVTDDNGDQIEVTLLASTDAGLREFAPPPSVEVLRRIHTDTEAYIDYLLQDVSGALRLVGDGNDERCGNSDHVGYHDYNWQELSQ